MAQSISSMPQFDRAGAGFGTTFLPAQKSYFGFLQVMMESRGLNCAISYAYQNDLAEATLTLNDANGEPVAAVKLSERWENFGDKTKPLVHTVYNYDVYAGTPESGWEQVAFAQMQEARVIPERLRDSLHDALNGLAREYDLFPKVRPVAFGASRHL